jgi:H+/Cl- antiporter ClcA
VLDAVLGIVFIIAGVLAARFPGRWERSSVRLWPHVGLTVMAIGFVALGAILLLGAAIDSN